MRSPPKETCSESRERLTKNVGPDSRVLKFVSQLWR